MCLSRAAEELFIFPHYFRNVMRLQRRSESADILSRPEFANYSTLTADELDERLRQEHSRASMLDDKTFKLTISLSVGLTVLGSVAALVIKAVAQPLVHLLLAAIVCVALVYLLLAGFVALGALRTRRTYGYGTHFLLLRRQSDAPNVAADALARQELVNTIRHLRNEAAYQALRNGLFLLFAGLLLFALAIGYQTLFPTTAAGDGNSKTMNVMTPPPTT